MKAYSLDLRQRVLKDGDAGMTTTEVATKYSVSPAWVRRLKQRRRETGQLTALAQRHGPRPAWQTHADHIRLAVAEAPDLTLREYIERFGLPLSKSALARALNALGLSRKKSRSKPASRNART